MNLPESSSSGSGGSGIMRCVRHPSMLFTGFCSSCLAERLSNSETSPKSLTTTSSSSLRQTEIVEAVDAPEGLEKSQGKSISSSDRGVRVRKTLQYLFQLDDNDDCSSGCNVAVEQNGGSEKDTVGIEKMNEAEYLRPSVSATYSAAVDVIVDAAVCVGDARIDNKEKGSLAWLSLVFPKKLSRWRRSSLRKKLSEEGKGRGGVGGGTLEIRSNARHSLDGGSHDVGRVSWEAPRHSWDGSVMSKALSCSFACLSEHEVACCKVKRNIPEEGLITDSGMSACNACDRVNGAMNLPGEGCCSSESGRYHDEFQEAITVSNIIRKKSNRWTKVWDRSITSPFKDSSKRDGHVLERSLSESWQDCDKNLKSMESVNDNCPSSVIKNHSLSRSRSGVSTDGKYYVPNWQKRKSEFNISRSRSVHYSSLGTLDNGLLRFYLTPLRTSRRCTGKARSKTSHSFARGLFGL